MKKIGLVLLCALAVNSAHAKSIAYVSFHSAENTPSANAAAAGFTQAPDAGYTALLTANGHAVTRFVTRDSPTAADATFLNGFDLVIIGRSVPSGHYQQADEASFWHTSITKPLISMGGYANRNSRMGFNSGATIPDTTNNIALSVLTPSHPIFAGVALTGANLMVNSFAGIASFTNNPQQGISVVTSPAAAGGTVLATVGTATDPTFGGMVIGEWQAGAVMADATARVLAGHRLVFLSGSRERGITSEGAGIFDLAGDGQAMFLNAVNYMTVPEPSTYVLLGIGALALLMRLRKS